MVTWAKGMDDSMNNIFKDTYHADMKTDMAYSPRPGDTTVIQGPGGDAAMVAPSVDHKQHSVSEEYVSTIDNNHHAVTAKEGARVTDTGDPGITIPVQYDNGIWYIHGSGAKLS